MKIGQPVKPARVRLGPSLFSAGFRPFFLMGASWAAVSMMLWMAMPSGRITLPTAFDPVSWHAHALLVGCLGAILAGFPLAMILFLVRQIVAGRSSRNLIVVVLISVFALGNALFHAEVPAGAYAARGQGVRLGLSSVVMMITVIGGRIVPSFTRNWLAKRGADAGLASPMQRFDKLALPALAGALLAWTLAPDAPSTGMLLMLAGALHLARLARWCGWRAGSEPLVCVLHVGYAFVPAGALVRLHRAPRKCSAAAAGWKEVRLKPLATRAEPSGSWSPRRCSRT